MEQPIVRSRHDAEHARYVAEVDGQIVSVAAYRIDGGTFVFHHTETRPELAGRGIATELVRFALDDVRRSGALIVPACSFVRRFVASHPEYSALVTSGVA